MKVAVCLLMALLGAGSARADSPVVHDFVIDVDGTPADGIYARASGQTTHLIVVSHGYTHTVDSWRQHLVQLATQTGALVVAMNYPTTFTGIGRGAAETTAAARHFKAKHPTIAQTYLLSVSMGNITAAIALAETNEFDWWVDVEGVSNLYETWSEATALNHQAGPDIANECGGDPLTGGTAANDAFTRRSAALRVDEISARGLKGAIVVHAPADGLVPYDQSRELVAGLTRTGVDVDFYTVVGRDCRLNDEGNTTIAGYGGANPQCLAGHASELLSDHVVIRTAFAALADLVAGRRRLSGTTERLVDEP